MKIVNVEQGTPEWLAWRRSVITATDASAILGSNPWVSPYKCWQRKLGLIPEQEANAAMQKGTKLEPQARTKFNIETGKPMIPVVVESTDYNFLGASLDGYDKGFHEILEIKCGGIDLFNQGMHGIVPDYYMDQMQHQLLVTQADKCYYYVFFEDNGISVEVLPDEAWQKKALPKFREFWDYIANVEAPPMTCKDYADKTPNPRWEKVVHEYQKKNGMLKGLESEVKSLRQELIEMCEDQSSQGHGLKCIKVVTKGRIDYDSIPELKEIDLNKYRKEATTSWKILQE